MSKRIVLVGAGHAHLFALSRARSLTDAGHSVTLVAPGRFWYSGMGPGVLAGRYSADEDTVDVARLVERGGGRHVGALASAIDADARTVALESGETIPYDLLSLNTGSGVPLDAIEGAREHAVPVKPVENFATLRHRWLGHAAATRAPRRIVVLGGGAAGCETALAAARLFRDATSEADVALVSGRHGVLATMPGRAQALMRRALAEHGITLLEGVRASRIDGASCFLDDGTRLAADDVVAATGVRPRPLAARSAIETDDEGAMIVDDCLRSVSHPEVLGGGDGIRFRPRPLDRVGVYAVRQGPVLHENLLALAEGRAPRSFAPQSRYLLILNVSDGTGLLAWSGLVYRGRSAFRLKERLDRGFIEGFQRSAAAP